jgi:hypothetical protein
LAWRYSTVNDGVTRFNGILKISETLTTPAAKGAMSLRPVFSRLKHPLLPWRKKRRASSMRRS